MSGDAFFYPFTTKSILTIPRLNEDTSQTWPGFRINTSLDSGLLSLAPSDHVKLESLQPNILTLDLEETPLSDIESSIRSSASQSDKDEVANENDEKYLKPDEEDLWDLPDVVNPPQENRLVSWDCFLKPDQTAPTVSYITEAGPAAFNRLLCNISKEEGVQKEPRYAKPDLLVAALFDLGFGRTSVFFRWNATSRNFSSNGDRFTVSGFSEQTFGEVVTTFLKSGSQWRSLEDFKSSKKSRNPMQLAFSGAIEDVLTVMREVLGSKRKATVTILQVQELFRQPFELLNLMYQVFEMLDRPPETDKHQLSTNGVITELFAFAERSSLLNPTMERPLFHVLARITHPAVQACNARVGLYELPGHIGRQYAQVLDQVLSKATSDQIESTEHLTQLLQQTAPQRLTPIKAAAAEISMSLGCSWDQISEFQQQASEYEQTCMDFIKNWNVPGERRDIQKGFSLSLDAASNCNGQAFVFDSNLFSAYHDPYDATKSADGLRDAVYCMFSGTQTAATYMLVPITQSIDFSIRPLLTVQYRVTSYLILQTLFTDLHLVQHMQSLWRFHCMIDGPFASRLSTALFDSTQSSSDVRSRTTGAPGLRLQNRDIWPPASSELRLVLMDTLAQSMTDIQNDAVVQATSFAIRDLNDGDLERCRDVNSIYALDFLRLHYKAPNLMLETVITTKALKRYDRIFMFLLRLLRIKDLTQYHLRLMCPRQIYNKKTQSSLHAKSAKHKLLWEMHRFTSAIANYAQNIAINSYQQQLETQLHKIKSQLGDNDYEGTLSSISSPDQLRKMHEEMLNDISTALFLRKSQHELRKKIDEIFGITLRFAASIQPGIAHEEDDYEEMTAEMALRFYHDFRGKIDLLLKCLNAAVANAHGANGRIGGDGGSRRHNEPTRSAEEENAHVDAMMAEHLLLALDFGGFYAKQRR